MKHHVWGVIAATAAAPYLITLCFLLIQPPSAIESELVDGLRLLSLGTQALFLTGLPLLCLSSLLAVFLNAKGWHAWWQAALGGAALGMTLLILLTATFGLDELRDPYLLASSGAVGAICGWIYWSIAMGRNLKTSAL